MQQLIWVFIGGGLGSLARFGLSVWIKNPPGKFPWATFAANLLACLVLGLTLAYLAQRSELTSYLRPLVLVGFCGGFSTFSTFSLETFKLLEGGQWGLALAYVMSSVFACLFIFWGLTQLLKNS